MKCLFLALSPRLSGLRAALTPSVTPTSIPGLAFDGQEGIGRGKVHTREGAFHDVRHPPLAVGCGVAVNECWALGGVSEERLGVFQREPAGLHEGSGSVTEGAESGSVDAESASHAPKLVHWSAPEVELPCHSLPGLIQSHGSADQLS
jgi:hypothetical protein